MAVIIAVIVKYWAFFKFPFPATFQNNPLFLIRYNPAVYSEIQAKEAIR